MAQPIQIRSLNRKQLLDDLQEKAARLRIPIRAQVELTYGCNLRCVHCYNPTHTAMGELSREAITAVLDQLAEAGCLEVAFTGGELFTRRDWADIAAHAKARGFGLVFLTNATMITPALADRLNALAPTRVEVSIYGATRETYERVTRIPGSFPLFLRGVRLLRERRIPLLLKMPVMTINRHEVRQAKALVEGWGIEFVYCHEIFPRVDGSREPLRYRLSPEECVRLDGEMVGHHKWRRGENSGHDGACRGQDGPFTCGCGRSSLAVSPYGKMNLCVALPIPQYDLGTGTVSQGWKTLVDLVDRTNKSPGPGYECPRCPVQAHCQQGPMNAWLETGRLEPCLPYFKELAALQGEAREAARRVGTTE